MLRGGLWLVSWLGSAFVVPDWVGGVCVAVWEGRVCVWPSAMLWMPAVHVMTGGANDFGRGAFVHFFLLYFEVVQKLNTQLNSTVVCTCVCVRHGYDHGALQ